MLLLGLPAHPEPYTRTVGTVQYSIPLPEGGARIQAADPGKLGAALWEGVGDEATG